MLDSQLGEEQMKKEFKIFKIGFLFGDMRTQARGCAHRPVAAYTGIMYAYVVVTYVCMKSRTDTRTHEHAHVCMKPGYVRMNTSRVRKLKSLYT